MQYKSIVILAHLLLFIAICATIIHMVKNSDTTRKPISFRLSEEGKRLLELLAADTGVSQTSVVEMALRDLAKTRGVKLAR